MNNQSPDAGAEVELEDARAFAQHVAPTLVSTVRRAVDLAEIQPGETILDLTTTTGLGAFLAAERAGSEGTVVGLDASSAMLQVAGQRALAAGNDHIRWQQGDAAQLTFADESFDVALCIQGIQTLPRPDAALEEARRVLVEEGRIVLTTWGSATGNEWIDLIETALRVVRGARPPRPFRLLPTGNLETLLQAAGFQQIEVARVGDRLRFHGQDAFWQWVSATAEWGPYLRHLPDVTRERVRRAVGAEVGPLVRRGEVALAREIVYARAVAPAAD